MTAPLPELFPEERRLATVLFADVHGFTRLSAEMDFESISYLIREVWQVLDSVIEQYGGYIDKHMGDGVMVVWGAPYSREDDAERAINTALGMQAALAEYAAGSQFAEAKQLRLRIGINTGQVLACYVGLKSEYTVMGLSVNIASRIEEIAEPGTVVISDNTHRLVRGTFDVQRLPELQLLGLSEPVPLYTVTGKRVQPSLIRYRGAGGLRTRMVGRGAEFARLGEMYKHVIETQQPMLVLAIGEAGMGKSRLLMEFVTRLDTAGTGLQLISARGLEQVANVPFFLWKSLWFNRFGISEGDPPDEAREKFLHGVQQLWGGHLGVVSAVETAHVLGTLCGLEWPDSPFVNRVTKASMRRRRAFMLTRFLLSRMAERGPVILLLDDLHWADRGSMDLLAELTEPGDEPLPLLALGAARPDQLTRHTLVFERAAFVELEPLPASADLVAAAYPDLAGLPKPLLEELARRGEGNPYFIEEMVKTLMRNKPPTGQLATDLETIKETLPSSLHGLLQSRLDALSPEARGVALLAAVVGRVFWVGALSAALNFSTGSTGILNVASAGLRGSVDQALNELTEAEMAFPRAGGVFTGEREYIFKHSLLRDVAYSLLPRRYRIECHTAIAGWLAVRAGPDFGAVVAEHYERAGDLHMAAIYYRKAADHAAATGAGGEEDWLKSQAARVEASAGG